uniref:Integrase catalytic domain-containing protein n=1 Tax=Astyanax mexicanus TaxID=7994 RepID=A0A3B1JMI7_ASTMX
MRTGIARIVASCSACAKCKTPKALPTGKLMPLPVPERPWSHLALDYVTDLPSSLGFNTVLTIIDRFSRGVRFIPFSSLPSTLQTAQALVDHVFRHFGIPEDIVSDRGPQFISRVWRAFCQHLGVNVSLTSGYHPQSNGQCERANQELGKFLRVYCHKNPEDWPKFLVWAEMAQNSLRCATTGLTPFQVYLGYQPPLAPWTAVETPVPAIDDWMRRCEEVWTSTHQQIQTFLRRYKAQADRRRGPDPDYQPGDRVWLATKDLRTGNKTTKKLQAKYSGPYTILRKINDVCYKLKLPQYSRVHNSFHVSLFKPVIPGPLDEATPSEAPPEPLEIEGAPAYRVKEVLDSRRWGNGLQYLLDWGRLWP